MTTGKAGGMLCGCKPLLPVGLKPAETSGIGKFAPQPQMRRDCHTLLSKTTPLGASAASDLLNGKTLF